MRLTKDDWAAGPVACTVCGRPMRPRDTKPEGRWEGTILCKTRGMCHACWTRGKRAKKRQLNPKPRPAAVTSLTPRPLPPGLKHVTGEAWRFCWEMLPTVPILHQDGEANTDLMGSLRQCGLVLTSRPTRRIFHGERAVMVLSFTAQFATKREAKVLQHPGAIEAVAA